MEKREILLDIRVRASDVQKQLEGVNKRLAENANSLTELKRQLKAGELSFEQFNQAQTAVRLESADLRKEASILTRQLQAQTKATNEAEGSNEQLKAQLSLLTAEYNRLSRAERENEQIGGKLRIQTRAISDELKAAESAVGNNTRNVGNYTSALDGLRGILENAVPGLGQLSEALTKSREGFEGGAGQSVGFGKSLKSLLGKGGAIFALGAALAALGVQAAQAIANITREFGGFRRQVNQLTGATGDTLNELTGQIQGVAQTFGKDFNEVLVAANAVSKQFGIGLGEALDQIELGFLNGADASGQYLDILSEYPAQLQAVGLSFEESNALILQQTQEGIFSDKGIDAIKEAGIRLRELTPATKTALEGIGLSAKAVQQGLESGSVPLFETIQQVSGQLNKLEDDSPAVGAALADIFGGPGEDAGVAYLKTLADVELNIEAVTKASDEFTEAQRRDLEATQDLGAAKAELAETFAPVVSFFDVFGKQVLTTVITGLNSITGFFTEILPSAFEGFLAGIEAVFGNVTGFVQGLVLDARIAAKEVQNFFSFSDSVQGEIDALRAQKTEVAGAYKEVGEAAAAAFDSGLATRREFAAEVVRQRQATTGAAGRNVATRQSTAAKEAQKEADEAAKARIEAEKKALEELIALEEIGLLRIAEVRRSGLVEAEKIDAEEIERKKRKIDIETQLALVGLELESAEARLIVAQAEEEKLAIVQEFQQKQIEARQAGSDAEKQILADQINESVRLESEALARRQAAINAEIQAEIDRAARLREIRQNTASAIADIENAAAQGDVVRIAEVVDNLVKQFQEGGVSAREALVSGIGGVAGAIAGVLQQVQGLIEVNDRESAERARKVQIAQLIFSGISSAAQALFRSISQFGLPLGAIVGGIASGVIGGITAAQVSALRSQPLGFADGGFTGGGMMPDPRVPGRKIAGVVHDREYVVPTRVMERPEGASLVQQLEGLRVRSYAQGGFVGLQPRIAQAESSFNLADSLMNSIARLPNPVVSVVEINKAQTRVTEKQMTGSL